MKQRDRSTGRRQPTPGESKPIHHGSTSPGQFMPMLTADEGVVWVNPTGADRSAVGGYWSAVHAVRDNRKPLALNDFEGRSIFDADTGKRFPFITDVETVLAYHEHFDFGPSFYKARGEVGRLAR